MALLAALVPTAGEASPQVDERSARDMELAAQVAAHLSARGFVPFHPALAERFGHRVALFVGVALYWTRYGLQHAPERGGWFHMSARQMADATTLTRHEQDTVRDTLKAKGILHEQLAGRPAVIHYRLNLRALVQALEVLDDPPEDVSFEHAWSWFRQCVSFYRPLADLAGSAAGGLYLSYLLRQQRVAVQCRQLHPGELIPLKPREVQAALKLTPKVIRATRERLRKAGLIHESRSNLVRVNVQAILACIRQQAIQPLPHRRQGSPVGEQTQQAPAASPPAAPTFHLTEPPSTMARRHLLPQSLLDLRAQAEQGAAAVSPAWSLMGLMLDGRVAGDPPRPSVPAAFESSPSGDDDAAESGNLGTAEVAQTGKLAGPIRQTALPNPAISLSTTDTTNTTTTAREVGAVDRFLASGDVRRRRSAEVEGRDPSDRAALSGLVYPQAIGSALRPAIDEVLRQFKPNLRQPLLDELQGQLSIPGKCIHNPVGWLLSVARKAALGTPLAMAESISAHRASQQDAAAAVAALQLERARVPAPQPRASDTEEGRKGLQRIRELRNEFQQKAGPR